MSEHKSWEEKTPEERAAAAAKIKACNDRSYARMAEINRIASETLVKTTHGSYTSGQYGQDYMAFGKAMCEIRKVVKDSVFDVEPDYEMLARQFARPCFDADKLAKAIEALAQSNNPNNPNNRTILPGCPSIVPPHLPSGADGTEPAAIEQSNNPNNQNNKSNPFYEFYGLKLQRFGGPGLDAKLIGKRVNHPSSQPSVQVFEIDLKRGSLATGARAFVTENGELLFSIVGGKSFAAVNEMAVSALHALLKRRDKANKRHKARRAAKRAAAAHALINKELA